MNKRGQELSTNTIIIVIIAVLVLIVVVVFFTGGFSTFVNKIQNLWKTTAQDVNEVVLSCNAACNNFQNTGVTAYKNSFCNDVYELDINGDKKVDQEVTCQDLPQVSCQAIEQAGGC